MLKEGFRKSFEDLAQAYRFVKENECNIEEGCDIGVYFNKPMVGVERIKQRDRSNESSNITGIIKDQLPGGVNGMLNHADGKRYDSKSAYERAVKAKGCRVIGNDWNKSEYKTPAERGTRGDFNVRPQLKEALQRHLNG